MAKDQQLVPVFMPPLAVMLARAEELKGSPLTEDAVVRLRDKAVCIMLKVGDAEKLTETRGYRDVNPENCWADWHRLRVQMTGKGYLPKIVLCLVGDSAFPERAGPILEELGIEHEFAPRDERIRTAFAASTFYAQPTLKKPDFDRIAKHESVLYVLSKNFTAGQAPDVSRTFLRAGARLLHAGAIAMKCEGSGVAHSSARWKALAKRTDDTANRAELWAGIFNAYLQYPIQSDHDHYTCGMHLLGKPDLIVATEQMPVEGAVVLFRAFAMYLLAECPEGTFASGHTFSTRSEATRYRVVWEPCTGYDEDDFFFNPFGRWRFTPAESKP